MSKLESKDRFLDLSDYGRTVGTIIANALKNTWVTPIHITLIFGITGLVAAYFILKKDFFAAGLFIILKSILDAADGELARIKVTPSYTGRYLDSIFDFILNFLFLLAIWYISKATITILITAFLCMEMQGTIYNYYYVIVRNTSKGADKTSQIFEYEAPRALPGEKQKWVSLLFKTYKLLYGVFDSLIYRLDQDANHVKEFPKWFLTLVSLYGLGFQLLLIAFLLALGWIEIILPFLIFYTAIMPILITIRKVHLK